MDKYATGERFYDVFAVKCRSMLLWHCVSETDPSKTLKRKDSRVCCCLSHFVEIVS